MGREDGRHFVIMGTTSAPELHRFDWFLQATRHAAPPGQDPYAGDATGNGCHRYVRSSLAGLALRSLGGELGVCRVRAKLFLSGFRRQAGKPDLRFTLRPTLATCHFPTCHLPPATCHFPACHLPPRAPAISRRQIREIRRFLGSQKGGYVQSSVVWGPRL
jgi:hypothetical protein